MENFEGGQNSNVIGNVAQAFNNLSEGEQSLLMKQAADYFKTHVMNLTDQQQSSLIKTATEMLKSHKNGAFQQ